MSAPLTLHELTGSPNSVKIRMALGYKGLDYERQPVDLDDFRAIARRRSACRGNRVFRFCSMAMR